MIAYSYTEKKRVRRDFGKRPNIMAVPYLLSIQLDSYGSFLQLHTLPEKREDIGLHAAFRSVFPIVSYSGNAELDSNLIYSENTAATAIGTIDINALPGESFTLSDISSMNVEVSGPGLYKFYNQ